MDVHSALLLMVFGGKGLNVIHIDDIKVRKLNSTYVLSCADATFD